MIFVLLVVVAGLGVVAYLYWPEIIDVMGLGSTCRHGIERDSYCTACREWMDRWRGH